VCMWVWVRARLRAKDYNFPATPTPIIVNKKTYNIEC
jgi:hypothetical protein